MINDNTIVAPATTPGTGAISIVRLSGPQAFEIADRVISLKSGTISAAKAYTIHYGSVFSKGSSVISSDSPVISSEVEKSHLLDEVLVSVFRAPHSYTGEDSVEISTHASSYIVTELIRLLISAGARMAEPGEFTRRAFINGKMDLAQAEAVADVISSTTSASHRVAMNQLKGHFSNELSGLREQLLEMASLLELELDFSEEDVEFADRSRLLALIEETIGHTDRLAGSFKAGNMIKNGVPVAIIGPTNAGKSTLLNALAGEDRAIVSDIAGTTRDTIEEFINIDGILFRFIDTAGLRDSEDIVEKMGIERSYRKLSEASIVLALPDSLASLEEICGHVDFSSQKLFVLVNKADSLSQDDINKNVTMYNNFVNSNNYQSVIIKLSAKTGTGVQELKSALSNSQKDLLSNLDSVFITNERHYNSLLQASDSLRAARISLQSGVPSELVAEDLRSAISSINAILGRNLLDPDTILHSIFSRHCIGK